MLNQRSILAMKFTTLDKISTRNLKLIPQSTVKCAFINENDRRNAIWDMFVTSEGRCFFSVCAELYVCESAGLYEYIYDTNEIKCCFELDKMVCYCKDAIMPSKIHTSISEMNDGRLIMTTHTTSQSRRHPYWHPEPFINHVYEGYQGSNILIYDPHTGNLENRGIPLPHESIYGGTYDPKHNAFYFTGYFKGHLYRYDVDTGNVTDYGKVTEFGSFRLFRSKIDGNIYSASRCGCFYRINTDTQMIEELGILFPKDYEPYSTEKHVQLDYICDGKDGNIYLHYIFGYNLYRYNVKKNALELVGDGRPDDLELNDPNQLYGLISDENGVLWYTLATLTECYDWTAAYLIKWDVLNGEKPKNMGLVGSKERSINIMAEMHYHNGILYLTNGNHHFDVPGMFAIDLKKLEGMNYDLNEENDETPLSFDVLNYLHLTDPKAYFPYGDDEYERQIKNVRIFTDYTKNYAAFMSKNTLDIKSDKINAYPFWKTYGRDGSPVHNVYYRNNELLIELGKEGAYYRYNAQSGVTEAINTISERAETISVPPTLVPSAVGRTFKAVPSASAEIWDGKHLVGTKDGILFIYDGKRAFNLGACPNTSGEVRQICYCKKTRKAYGIVGSSDEICIVFSFDEENGVKYLGRTHFNIESGLYLSCELSSIAVNEDGTKLAIGSNEKMGIAYELSI